MSVNPTVLEVNKAATFGISFNPSSLAADAKAYGASLEPKIGLSHVVCRALTEFLGVRGALNTKVPAVITPEESAAIEQAKSLGIDLRAALLDAIERKALSTPSNELTASV